MLEIAEIAAQALKSALAKSEGKGDDSIRVIVNKQGALLKFDQQRPRDTVLKYDEELVVLMDPVSAKCLEDRKLVYDEESESLVFV